MSTLSPDLGYSAFLEKHRLTEAQVWAEMRALPSPVPHPIVDEAFTLCASKIHGVGVAARRPIAAGEVFPVCRGATRFLLARYTNHSDAPAARLEFDAAGNGTMHVLHSLAAGDEVTMDYNENLRKSQAISCQLLTAAQAASPLDSSREIALLEDAMRLVFRETPTREQIEQIEAEMLRFPQLTIQPTHYFAAGLYGRQITIPAGALLTGKIHATETLNIVLTGDMSVWTQNGFRRVQAPCVFVSPPGLKRIGMAHSDCTWVTVNSNPTDERDIDALDAFLLAPPNSQPPTKP